MLAVFFSNSEFDPENAPEIIETLRFYCVYLA